MPTPSAPPSTDSAVRSMPTTDSANSRPMNSRPARSTLAAALRRDSCSPLAPSSSRDSRAADTHSASTSTKPADSTPSSRVRRLSGWAPSFHCTSSSHSSSTGSSPVNQSTTAAQAIQEMVRSTSRIIREAGNAADSTRTLRRMRASEVNTGTATASTVTGSPAAWNSRLQT